MRTKIINYLLFSVACIVPSLGTLPTLGLAEFIIYDLAPATVVARICVIN